jgi:PAS domain S-box-containing protein
MRFSPSQPIFGLISRCRKYTKKQVVRVLRKKDRIGPSAKTADGVRLSLDGSEYRSPLAAAPEDMASLYRADTGEIIYASEPFRERFGPEGPGASLFALLPESLCDELRRDIEGISPDRPVSAFVHRVATADGDGVWIEWRSRGFFDSEGKFRLVLSSACPVGERDATLRCVRTFDSYYRLLINGDSEVVYYTDQNGIIRFISDTVARVSGWKPQEIVGSHYMNFIHPDDMMSHIDYMKSTLEGGPFRAIVTRIRTRGGDYQYARIESRLAIINGKADGVVGIISHAPDNIGNEYQILRMLLHLLSKNERIVLMLFADGKTRRSAARSLNTVPEAIDTYLRRIRKKLGTEDIKPILEMIRMYPKEYFSAK